MNKNLYTLFMLLVMVSGLTHVTAFAKTDPLLRDMVQLDLHYIAALAHTSQQKLKPALQAMARLIPAWQEFKIVHRDMAKKDASWKEDMEKIDGYIHAANKIVSAGKNLTDAHEELEHIRIVMMNARERNNIDYFIDHLTRFHEPMEALVLAVKGKSVSDINNAAVSKMKSDLQKANRLWLKVNAARFDQHLFGFTDEKTKLVNELKMKESMALSTLGKALNGNDASAIIQSGLAIKPPFAKMFMLFAEL